MSYRYLGNKTQLAPWIVDEIEKHVPTSSSVNDPMCGTASVSAELAKRGYSVHASDSLRFPVIHASSRLLAKTVPPFAGLGGYDSALRWVNTLPPTEGYFYTEFGAHGNPANGRGSRLYFTAENAARIDGIRLGIREAARSGAITHIEHCILLQGLLLATNSVANISGTYGYFRRIISSSALRPLEVKPQRFTDTPGDHTVTQGTLEDLSETLSADATYLDPPYTKRQYAGNYHILETIAREDEPPAIGDGGLRPWRQDASDFCYKRKAPDAFRRVLARLSSPHIFISYSEDGQVEPSALESLFSDFGKVTTHTHLHPRYRSNNRGKAGPVTEYLYHIER